MRRERLGDRAVLVVGGRVEPGSSVSQSTFSAEPALPTTREGTEQPRHLTGDRADGTGGAGHEDRVALLQRGDPGSAPT